MMYALLFWMTAFATPPVPYVDSVHRTADECRSQAARLKDLYAKENKDQRTAKIATMCVEMKEDRP